MATDTKNEVLIRLKKIEGQIRGLQRMIEEGQDCTDVVHQLSAARKALDKVGFIILSHRMLECIEKKDGSDSREAMDEALKLFLTLS